MENSCKKNYVPFYIFAKYMFFSAYKAFKNLSSIHTLHLPMLNPSTSSKCGISVNAELYFKNTISFLEYIYLLKVKFLQSLTLMEDIRKAIQHKIFISILIQLNAEKMCFLTWQTKTSTFKYACEKGLGNFWSILLLAHEQE